MTENDKIKAIIGEIEKEMQSLSEACAHTKESAIKLAWSDRWDGLKLAEAICKKYLEE